MVTNRTKKKARGEGLNEIGAPAERDRCSIELPSQGNVLTPRHKISKPVLGPRLNRRAPLTCHNSPGNQSGLIGSYSKNYSQKFCHYVQNHFWRPSVNQARQPLSTTDNSKFACSGAFPALHVEKGRNSSKGVPDRATAAVW